MLTSVVAIQLRSLTCLSVLAFAVGIALSTPTAVSIFPMASPFWAISSQATVRSPVPTMEEISGPEESSCRTSTEMARSTSPTRSQP